MIKLKKMAIAMHYHLRWPPNAALVVTRGL